MGGWGGASECGRGGVISHAQVDALPDRTRKELQPTVPDYRRRYYESNAITKFTFSRPFKKEKTGNEFLDLWTQKTVLTTVEGCGARCAAPRGDPEPREWPNAWLTRRHPPIHPAWPWPGFPRPCAAAR